MQATARRLSVVSSTLPARCRLIRDVRPMGNLLVPIMMSTQQPETVSRTDHQRRSSGGAGGIVLVGWFLLMGSINTLSMTADGDTAGELLILRLVVLCLAVVPLIIALFRGERATRISALLGLGFAVFILYCIFS